MLNSQLPNYHDNAVISKPQLYSFIKMKERAVSEQSYFNSSVIFSLVCELYANLQRFN